MNVLTVAGAHSENRKVVILGGAHGSLALARSLGKAGADVYYITSDSPLAGWSRYVTKTIRLPAINESEIADFLLNVAGQNNLANALLIPASDREVKLVSQYIGRLSPAFTILLPEWDRLRWLCDKPYLYKRAVELGLTPPETYELSSADEALELELVYPVILKPNMGGGEGTLAKAKVIRVDDRDAFIGAFGKAAKELGAKNIVVQQLIPGGGECQFSYAAFWREGEPVAEFSARRSRQYPVEFGFTSTFVETVDAPEVIAAARTILASVRYSGLVEVEFKRDPRTGVLNILDVNPRPWSWFALCAAAGADLGKIMWDSTNCRVAKDRIQAVTSVSWIYLVRDLVSSVQLVMRGKLSAIDYLASLRSVRACAAFSWHDLKPGLLDFPLTVWRVLTRRILNISI